MAYRVVAGYVTAQTKVKNGRAYIDIPRGTELPGDVPAEEVEWLLRSGQIEEIDSAEPEPETDPEEPADLDSLDKDELLELAESKGVQVDKRWGAEKLAAAIRGHEE